MSNASIFDPPNEVRYSRLFEAYKPKFLQRNLPAVRDNHVFWVWIQGNNTWEVVARTHPNLFPWDEWGYYIDADAWDISSPVDLKKVDAWMRLRIGEFYWVFEDSEHEQRWLEGCYVGEGRFKTIARRGSGWREVKNPLWLVPVPKSMCATSDYCSPTRLSAASGWMKVVHE